ncbi:MAG TPA: hypothetical protein VF131_04730 [Blastocatellia bacterium]|nr:hypothetical protein [Blastocatellia bacterium]
MAGEDRLTLLLEQNAVTGIDFVQVVDPEDQTVLRVFFLIDPDKLNDPIVNTAALPAAVPTTTVKIESISGGERLADVPVVRTTYNQVLLNGETRTVLEIETAEPGNFSIYRLAVIDEPKRRIDRFFNNVEFSFKQGCPSLLDCKRPGHECPPEPFVDFPVDYLARDFVSIRNALLDYAAQRYPRWIEKIEADAGVMLAEVMAALGDEFSYIQDRYAREAYLETATQRRSLRYHTQLVDYPIHDGLSAGTFLDLTVISSVGGAFVSAGKRVWAIGQGESPIPFELGNGLADTTADDGGPRQFWVQAAWNTMPVHLPDDSQPCLGVGATELFLRGTFPAAAQIPAGEDPAKFWIAKWLLLRTDPEDPSIPVRRHLIRVVEVEHTTDPLTVDLANNPIAITRIKWEDEQALPFEMCLPDMVVHGNLVFATAGETIAELFTIRTNNNIPQQQADRASRAVERQGPLDDVAGRRSVTFLSSLGQTETDGLGWLGALRDARPEVELQEVNATSLLPLQPPRIWEWQRSLLDSRNFEDHFALDHGTWRRIIGFQRIGEVIEHLDYASGSGFTIRFGDGEFGKIPGDGTVFQVRYRTGPGTRANLPADTIIHLTNPANEAEADLTGVLVAATNPLAVTSGVDSESAEAIKQLAPEAFRAITFRAVRPEDYAEIAERLPFVQRAGARFRWTGSWLSTFVTADPLGSFQLSPEQRTELTNLMDCVRQAGREVFVRNPRFVNIDLEIRICVEPFAYAGQVKGRVIETLLGRKGVRATKGFFHQDNFTFGTPLRRAALEAVIQDVPGVRGVEQMRIRARGITDWRAFDELTFPVRHDQIIRLANDPRFPERGSLRIVTREEEQP